MDFKQASKLSSFLSKEYSEDLFRLLWTYTSISASEAASRLNRHIKTIQDYLEALHELGLLSREEVMEKKRPYFRYRLTSKQIKIELNLEELFPGEASEGTLSDRIRESSRTSSRFTVSRDGQHISNVVIWIGTGRDRTERKINLSTPQGRFLFYLPFPTAEPLSISAIIKKADIDGNDTGEIMDIVNDLANLGVIERF
jgi:DNA-binding MarR family transcriptional regulator